MLLSLERITRKNSRWGHNNKVRKKTPRSSDCCIHMSFTWPRDHSYAVDEAWHMSGISCIHESVRETVCHALVGIHLSDCTEWMFYSHLLFWDSRKVLSHTLFFVFCQFILPSQVTICLLSHLLLTFKENMLYVNFSVLGFWSKFICKFICCKNFRIASKPTVF